MVDIDKKLTDAYFQLLEKLGDTSKLDLISRLSSSMKDKKEKTDKSVLALYGSFDTDETAEEMIDLIRSSRMFNRKIEDFE